MTTSTCFSCGEAIPGNWISGKVQGEWMDLSKLQDRLDVQKDGAQFKRVRCPNPKCGRAYLQRSFLDSE